MPDQGTERSRFNQIFDAMIDVGDVFVFLGVLVLLLILLTLCLCGPFALWLWNN